MTAIDTLDQLADELDAKGMHMSSARMRSNVQGYLQRAGIADKFAFYISVDSALQAFSSEPAPSAESADDSTTHQTP